MSEPRSLTVVVVGDDAVAAGMVALDLVQAGLRATAARDAFAVMDALHAARAGGELARAAVVSSYDDIGRTVALWQQLQELGLPVRFVAAVQAADRPLAEHEAIRGGWAGVITQPIDATALAESLRRPPPVSRSGAEPEGEFGDLAALGLGGLIDQILARVGRGGRSDVVLRLESDGRNGEVAILDGELVHAVADADQGRHALERMYCWRRGSWRAVWGRHVGARTIVGNWRNAVAAAQEYARRVDDARVTMPLADRVCQVRWERARPLPPVAEAVFRRVAAGTPIGLALDGEGDDEIEALAALHARIARGAVVAREGDGVATTSGGWNAAARPATGAFAPARASGAHGRGDAWTAPHRHAETATYKTGGFAPVGAGVDAATAGAARPPSAGRARPTLLAGGGAPAASVQPPDAVTTALPEQLPEPYHEEREPGPAAAGDRAARRPATGAWRSTNWFGVNVREDAIAGQARMEAIAQAIAPAPAPAARPVTQAFAPSVAAAAPTPARATTAGPTPLSDAASALDAWTDRDADEAEAVAAPEPAPSPPRRRRLALSLLLLALGAGLVVLVLWPASPLYRAIDGESDDPVAQSHRRALVLIDTGRKAEALAVLQLLAQRPGVAAEALLEEAILRYEFGDREGGGRAMHRYLLHPRARHVEAARRLFDHVGRTSGG